MEAPYTPLPAELRQALLSSTGEPLHLIDDETQKVYLLVEQEPSASVDDDHIRKLLQEAHEDVQRGDVGPWDMEEIKAEGQRMLAERRANRGQ
jgi:hypothetical protein